MSFLFKSKKPPTAGTALPQAPRNVASRDGVPNGSDAMNFGLSEKDDEKIRSPLRQQFPAAASRVAPSPTPESRHVVGRGNGTESPMKGPRVPQRQPPDVSLYPWSNQRFSFLSAPDSNPFPRYGASVNSTASKDGEIYMMGGLVDGNTVKGDLWIIEAGAQPINCYQVPTTSEGPGPRVGHRSLLVGNAFIVFGGDTKMHEQDILDDTLYLLNTSSKHWSRAAPAGPRPAGRYGHTLNILGSRIYVFGGQVEGYFFNDLVAFDLNSLQGVNSHWEVLVQNSADGGPPQGQIPPARTNHTIITYEDKLYLFGGTDGVNWFNDVWSYDARINAWSQQECIGFIPAAREGHNATLVGDVMYIFGGRTDEGKDLGDVAGFRIPTRRWYTFQNMGPSPSPRSGHGMTSYGEKILVFGGEPSSAPRDPVELSEVYTLDTSKIRYPEEKPAARSGTGRRPSITDRSGTPQQERSASRDGYDSSQGMNGRQLTTRGSQDSVASNSGAYAKPQEQIGANYLPNGAAPKPARMAPSPVPSGPPPQQPAPQPRANGIRNLQPNTDGRESPRSPPKADRMMSPEPSGRDNMTSPTYRQREIVNGPGPTAGLYTSPREGNFVSDPTYSHQQQGSGDSTNRRMTATPDAATRTGDDVQSSFKQQTYADSGVGSSPAMSTQQNDNVARELEAVKGRNAWYATELALARKAGYRGSSSADSPTAMSDDRTVDAFGEEERPLLEAFLRMRAELAKMQESLSSQSSSAAERIAQAEREKQAAISEATYHKTQLASRELPLGSSTETSARMEEANRRLASTLAAQSGLQAQIQSLSQALESERKAREASDGSAAAAHARATELDSHKQQTMSELESLRAQLHDVQRDARDQASTHADTLSSSKLTQVENRELTSRLTAAQEAQRSHGDILRTLRDAATSSQQTKGLLERRLEEEQGHRASAEEKLVQLRSEHESRTSELNTATQRLREAQELAEHHANEAQTHREAVLAGLGKDADRNIDPSVANDERVDILQQRLSEASALADRHKDAANAASERLRSAEERIAGLESYQEQSSREGLSLRKQLQSTSRDAVARQSEHAELSRQLDQHKLDLAGWQAQNQTLRNILADRGFDTSQLPTDLSSYQLNSDNSKRIQQLEDQLQQAAQSQEELRQAYSNREQQMRLETTRQNETTEKEVSSLHRYVEKCQDVVEKMKAAVAEEKTKNRALRDQLERGNTPTSATRELETERSSLRSTVTSLQARLEQHQSDISTHLSSLKTAAQERDNYRDESLRYQRALQETHSRNSQELDAMRAQNSALETRADEAERKVQMLLDTIGSSVETYKRQSQSLSAAQMQGFGQGQANGTSPGSAGSSFAASSFPGPPRDSTQNNHVRGFSLASLGAESEYSTHSRGNSASHIRAGSNALDSDLDAAATAADGSHADNRHSMAYEGMLSELERMRNDWAANRETYSHRLSGGAADGADDNRISVIDGPGPTAALSTSGSTRGKHGHAKSTSTSNGNGFGSGSLASWRRGLSMGDEDDDDDDDDDDDGRDGAQQGRDPAVVAATAAVASAGGAARS